VEDVAVGFGNLAVGASASLGNFTTADFGADGIGEDWPKLAAQRLRCLLNVLLIANTDPHI